MATDPMEPMTEAELLLLWEQLRESFVAEETTDDIEQWLNAYYCGRDHLVELLRLLWRQEMEQKT